MDFAALPPEVNSARIYAGPGAAPMLAAAAAWEALAVELSCTANEYSSVVTCLTTGPWRGQAAESMATAIGAHIAWLTDTGELAEQTADQATAAATAFEAAFALTVPPPIIATNRSLRASLAATNVFGQNTPAIMTTDAQYAEMWAQDAAAMYEYAAASARAASLTPFAAPAGGALLDQPAPTGAAVAAAATAPATGISAFLQQLGPLTSPLSLLSPANTAEGTVSLANAYAASESASQARTAIMGVGYEISGTEDQILGRLDRLGAPRLTGASTSQQPITVSARTAAAAAVGGLSVPPAWAPAPVLRSSVAPLATTMRGAAGDTFAAGKESLLEQLAVRAPATVGYRVAGTRCSAASTTPPRSVEPPHGPAPGSFATLAANLYELARLRELGILTDDEFTGQKRRLLAE